MAENGLWFGFHRGYSAAGLIFIKTTSINGRYLSSLSWVCGFYPYTDSQWAFLAAGDNSSASRFDVLQVLKWCSSFLSGKNLLIWATFTSLTILSLSNQLPRLLTWLPLFPFLTILCKMGNYCKCARVYCIQGSEILRKAHVAPTTTLNITWIFFSPNSNGQFILYEIIQTTPEWLSMLSHHLIDCVLRLSYLENIMHMDLQWSIINPKYNLL